MIDISHLSPEDQVKAKALIDKMGGPQPISLLYAPLEDVLIGSREERRAEAKRLVAEQLKAQSKI